MIQEIITLVVDQMATQYYINFEKDRKKFLFQPTLKNKTAPSFSVIVEKNNLITEDLHDEKIAAQAKDKLKEILANNIFDQI